MLTLRQCQHRRCSADILLLLRWSFSTQNHGWSSPSPATSNANARRRTALASSDRASHRRWRPPAATMPSMAPTAQWLDPSQSLGRRHRCGIAIAAAGANSPNFRCRSFRTSTHVRQQPDQQPSNSARISTTTSEEGVGTTTKTITKRRPLNEFGHDYDRIGGPVDPSSCTLSQTEIHLLLCARIECKRMRDFERADDMRGELRRGGVFVDDGAREWRADGKMFPRKRRQRRGGGESSAQSGRRNDEFSEEQGGTQGGRGRFPRVSECRTMEDAIQAVHENLDRASLVDMAAFWGVVPRLINARSSPSRQKMVPQLKTILDETMGALTEEGARPKDLSYMALVLANCIASLRTTMDRNAAAGRGSIYHDFLKDVLVDKRVAVFRSIAGAVCSSDAVLSRFEPRHVSTLANACAVVGHAPVLDDGTALFDRIAERSIVLQGKFRPQDLVLALRSFRWAGTSHPLLFERVADHLTASPEDLDEFRPRDLSGLLLAYSGVGEENAALFEGVADRMVAALEVGGLQTFKPRELSGSVRAFAQAGVSHDRLFDMVADHVVGFDDLDRFRPNVLADLLTSYAREAGKGRRRTDLFDRIAEHVVALDDLNEFRPRVIADVARAFAEATGASHPLLFERLARHVATLRDLEGFEPRDVGDLAWAFAKAGGGTTLLFDRVADHVVGLESLDRFDGQDLGDLIVAFATTSGGGSPRGRHDGMFGKVADHLVALEGLEEKFDRRNIDDLAWAFSHAGVDDSHLYEKLRSVVLEGKD